MATGVDLEAGAGQGLPTVPPLPAMGEVPGTAHSGTAGTAYAADWFAYKFDGAKRPETEMPKESLSKMISEDDLVTPRDMTGSVSPSVQRAAMGMFGAPSRPTLNSPQRLAVAGDSGHVAVQGVKPYVHKTPWDPPAWSSPGKQRSVGPASTPTVPDRVILTLTQSMLAGQLAGLDVALAAQVVEKADRLRLQRVRRRVERDIKARRGKSMRDAVFLIAQCRGLDPYTPMEAEATVRERIGRQGEHPLHQYGFLLHVAMYPFTILLAIGGYVCIALSALASVGVEVKPRDGQSCVRRTIVKVQRFLLTLSTFIMVLPISIICVAICAAPDIILLLARPVLPLRIKLRLLPWFFPTSLAFWSAGTFGGFVGAFLSNIVLGACPVTNAFASTSLGGQLCNTQSDLLPISSAFQCAVVCAPHFMGHHKSLRSTALRGIPEFYAPAGGKLAQMPYVVQWAYLLGDADLCAAWEAESMGYLPVEGGPALKVPR